jgi:hypothetical protein
VTSDWHKRALVCVIVLVVLLAGGWARQRSIGAQAYRASTAALNLGDLRSAVAEARTAAETLGSPSRDAALGRLRTIAREATARGDKAIAKNAWLALAEAGGATDRLELRSEAVRELEQLDGAGTWSTFQQPARGLWGLSALCLLGAVIAMFQISKARSVIAVVLVLAASAFAFF